MSDSVQRMLRHVESPESAVVSRAAHELWDRFGTELTNYALRKLSHHRAPRREADEEDAALSAFQSFFRGAQEGRFEDINDASQIAATLKVITKRKVFKQIARRKAAKRGAGKVRGASAFMNADSDAQNGPAHFEAIQGTTPEELMIAEESCAEILNWLRDDQHREIVTDALNGLSAHEISEKVGVSKRTIERRLKYARTLLAERIVEAIDDKRLQNVLRWSSEGVSDREIAERLDCESEEVVLLRIKAMDAFVRGDL